MGDGMNEQLKEEIVKILLDTIEENVKLIRGKNTTYPNASDLGWNK